MRLIFVVSSECLNTYLWINITFGTHNYVPLRMSLYNFHYALTFSFNAVIRSEFLFVQYFGL